MTCIRALIPCLKDNYATILHDNETMEAICIDAPDAAPILAYLTEKNLNLTHVLVTHHHNDHVAGLENLKAHFSCEVIGPQREINQIPQASDSVMGGDVIACGAFKIEAIDTPGHTKGHLSYFLPDEKIVFTGDTLFVMGCGRLLECDAITMWDSLQKLKQLPEGTALYCGHEYAKANAIFAKTVMPGAACIQARAGVIDALRRLGRPVMPTTIGEELVSNPFLLAKSLEEFTELRLRKDTF